MDRIGTGAHLQIERSGFVSPGSARRLIERPIDALTGEIVSAGSVIAAVGERIAASGASVRQTFRIRGRIFGELSMLRSMLACAGLLI